MKINKKVKCRKHMFNIYTNQINNKMLENCVKSKGNET